LPQEAGSGERKAKPEPLAERRTRIGASLGDVGIENPLHLLFIAIVALVVLGPRRLPDLAKSLGHGIREFRESLSAGAEHRSEEPPGGDSSETHS
jgi:TatA/E family protein of Tat protein translocase